MAVRAWRVGLSQPEIVSGAISVPPPSWIVRGGRAFRDRHRRNRQWRMTNTNASNAAPMKSGNAAAKRMANTRNTGIRLAKKSSAIMRLGRDAFYRQRDMDFKSALEYLHAQVTLVTLTEDSAEGRRAFFEKREPDFKGR